MQSTYIESLEPRRLLSGVTLFTHGQGGDAGGRVAEIADLVANRIGTATQYVMTIENDNGNVRVGSVTRDPDTPLHPSNGEIIIKVDWSDADLLPTTLTARAVADYLLAPRSSGRAMVEQEISLAGPSRGASMISNLAQVLGRRGVWVDQVTYIDPIPVDIPGLPADGPMRVSDNVVFSDNYWREDNDISTLDGESVNGSHNVDLADIVNDDNDGDPHVAAGAYYIATVDPSVPITSPARASWFGGGNPDRDEIGFIWHRLVGKTRPSDGVGRAFGGTAHRDAVTKAGKQWPNVHSVTVLSERSVASGDSIRVRFQFGDSDTRSTVSIFIDRDRDPYNQNSVSRIARASFTATESNTARLGGKTTEAPPGTYYIYAQITDNDGHVRYAYAPQRLTVTAGESRLSGTTPASAGVVFRGFPPDSQASQLFGRPDESADPSPI